MFKVPTTAPKKQPIFFLNSVGRLKVLGENCKASGYYLNLDLTSTTELMKQLWRTEDRAYIIVGNAQMQG